MVTLIKIIASIFVGLNFLYTAGGISREAQKSAETSYDNSSKLFFIFVTLFTYGSGFALSYYLINQIWS